MLAPTPNEVTLTMSYLDTRKMVGDAQARHVSNGHLDIKKRGGRYTAFIRGERFHADILNVEGAAAALSDGATLEIGGTHEKRLTVTVAPTNETYLYVEVDE